MELRAEAATDAQPYERKAPRKASFSVAARRVANHARVIRRSAPSQLALLRSIRIAIANAMIAALKRVSMARLIAMP
jgi:hypothetical protein